MNGDKRKLIIAAIILLSVMAGYIFSVPILSAVIRGETRPPSSNWRLPAAALLLSLMLSLWTFRKTLTKILKKAGLKVWIGVLAFLLMASWFCWSQYRPSKARTRCSKYATKRLEEKAAKGHLSIDSADKLYNLWYKDCLHEHGL